MLEDNIKDIIYYFDLIKIKKIKKQIKSDIYIFQLFEEKRQTIEDMMYSRLIELCPLYAIRGRSIHNAYLICDEAQNATKGLIKDVVTRAGKNTKIIVAGDPTQIDNTSLSLHNNGLVYLKNCMKGDPLCAIIRFENDNCVRSDLAENALNRMK